MITNDHERFIEQAIEIGPVQRASFPYWLAIADDCSTDGRGDIIRRYAVCHPVQLVFDDGHSPVEYPEKPRTLVFNLRDLRLA